MKTQDSSKLGTVGFFGHGQTFELSLSRLLKLGETQILELKDFQSNARLDADHDTFVVRNTNGKISLEADVIGSESFYSISHPELKELKIQGIFDCQVTVP